MKWTLPIIALFIPACSGPAPTKEQAFANLQLHASQMTAAIAKNDVAAAADLTHPNLVRQMGGRTKYIEAVREIQKEMMAEGTTITSVDIGAIPAEWTESKGEFYVVIPTVVRMTAPESTRIKLKSGLIAFSSDRGRTWRFVDANGRKGLKALKAVMPNFPDGLPLPKVTVPTIDD